jgi:hypothetical protein
MPATLKVTDRDFGWKGLEHAVLKLGGKGAFTLVGVQGAHAAANVQDTALTYAQLARIHEFGAGRSPERSFIRATIDKYQSAIQKRAIALGRGVLLDAFSVEQALELLGEYVVGLIRQRIADGIAPRNKPSTIKRKGSSKPLIDTGGLRASITHRPEAR